MILKIYYVISESRNQFNLKYRHSLKTVIVVIKIIAEQFCFKVFKKLTTRETINSSVALYYRQLSTINELQENVSDRSS